MKKTFCLLVATLMCSARAADSGGLSGQVVGGSENRATVTVGLVRVPVLTQATSGSRIEAAVGEFERTGRVTSDVGLLLKPDYVLLDGAETNELVAAIVKITARETNTFTVDQLRFRTRSADSGNALFSSVSYEGKTFNFSGTLIGVDVAGNRRTNGLTAGVQLKELTVGVFYTPYWKYPRDASYEVLSNHVANNIRTVWYGFGLQAAGQTNLMAWSERMLTVNPVTQPTAALSIALGTNMVARLNYTNNTSFPVVLQRTSAFATNTSWTDLTTVGQGAVLNEQVTNAAASFYRLYLQGAQ